MSARPLGFLAALNARTAQLFGKKRDRLDVPKHRWYATSVETSRATFFRAEAKRARKNALRLAFWTGARA